MVADWGELLAPLLTGAIGAGIGGLFGRRLRHRRVQRRMRAGRAELSARSPDGWGPSLSRSWRTYVATPRMGALVLHRRFRRDRAEHAMTVLAVDPGTRRPRARELWSMQAVKSRVLTVRTPEGRLELAVPDHQEDWLRERLAGPGN
ncbi:hypothetical protein IN07_14350 [Modestobacter caceresii]|uniref:Uncharacterized protein n=1 Tax=Modestobacter caceresii TaxID=1522368 RepID=A0A098Y8C7_9ACTN|nr:hypothetical protein [Modestobacter caceresii]KGH45961.1 hypothetical protein IN07_14350 [Modestobacter caceresii]